MSNSPSNNPHSAIYFGAGDGTRSVPATIPLGLAATLACLYEATARKPGNVYPGAAFDQKTTHAAFVTSAIAIGPIIHKAPNAGVGQTVLGAVRATRDAVGTNTNLGTLLLIAPLAAVPRDMDLESGVGRVLAALTADDTRAVYEAIRLASAGGLGQSAKADIHDDPPPDLTLVDAMRLAADRDLVARQYVNSFHDVLAVGRFIEFGLTLHAPLEDAIVLGYLKQLAAAPDSLIQRKLGPAIAQQASQRAAQVLLKGSIRSEAFQSALTDLDRWLRADGNRRNPGTTADLIAAGLFVLLRDGRLNWSEW
jgi:triphosphoribosyl-dephospho-CoA synthase